MKWVFAKNKNNISKHLYMIPYAHTRTQYNLIKTKIYDAGAHIKITFRYWCAYIRLTKTCNLKCIYFKPLCRIKIKYIYCMCIYHVMMTMLLLMADYMTYIWIKLSMHARITATNNILYLCEQALKKKNI